VEQMKPREIVDKLLEADEPPPEELVQATDMGREGLENHLRQQYGDTVAVTLVAPYLMVSCAEGVNMGGSIYSVVASWLRRKGADLPVRTFGPARQYGVQPPVGVDKYVFELYREALQFLA
jgi:hypothetical protein